MSMGWCLRSEEAVGTHRKFTGPWMWGRMASQLFALLCLYWNAYQHSSWCLVRWILGKVKLTIGLLTFQWCKKIEGKKSQCMCFKSRVGFFFFFPPQRIIYHAALQYSFKNWALLDQLSKGSIYRACILKTLQEGWWNSDPQLLAFHLENREKRKRNVFREGKKWEIEK